MKNLWCYRIVKLFVSFMIFSSAYANVLFICDGNSGRSYMAYQIAGYFLYYPSFSRGLNVKSTSVEPNAKEVLMEWNIDVPYVPTALKEEDIASAKQVLVMTTKQLKTLKSLYPQYQNKFQLLSTCAGYPELDVKDPLGRSLKYYQDVRDQIYTYEQVISANGWECVRSIKNH